MRVGAGARSASVKSAALAICSAVQPRAWHFTRVRPFSPTPIDSDCLCRSLCAGQNASQPDPARWTP